MSAPAQPPEAAPEPDEYQEFLARKLQEEKEAQEAREQRRSDEQDYRAWRRS